MSRFLAAGGGNVRQCVYVRIALVTLASMMFTLALGCAAEPPAPVATPDIPATVTAGVATRIATQSVLPGPTATAQAAPTPTPLPPVSINPDCVGCPVVAPGAGGTQQVMEAYAEWTGAGKHPDPVVLVTCDLEEHVAGVGRIAGAQGNNQVPSYIAVLGFYPDPDAAGGCFAITAKYDGLKEICVETTPGLCRIGQGSVIEILGFKTAGESTEVSTSQYRTLVEYARATQYQVGDQ